jgi:hypothetical protein
MKFHFLEIFNCEEIIYLYGSLLSGKMWYRQAECENSLIVPYKKAIRWAIEYQVYIRIVAKYFALQRFVLG